MTQKTDQISSTLTYYNENATKFIKGTVNVDMSEFYQEFLSLLPKHGTILDAGCGSGRDTKFFLEQGYEVIAFDNSPEIVKMASEYTSHDITLLSFSDVTFKDQFEGVWACSSLLHVPLVDMPDAILRLESSLKNNGIMYISFKYGEGELLRNKRFFTDYTETSFNDLIKITQNLEVVKFWKTSDLRPERENEKWLNILLRKVLG